MTENVPRGTIETTETIETMKTSEQGRRAIMRFEGCKLKAYKCSAGVWTIGYGHTENVREGMTITQAEAEAFLEADLVRFERNLDAQGVILSQNEFDALISFSFNVGCAALNDSTLLRRVKESKRATSRCEYDTIRYEFLRWNKAGGKVVQGLADRRAYEACIYINNQYPR